MLHERLDERLIAVYDGDHERTLAVLVYGVHLGVELEQDLGHVARAVDAGGANQRRPAVVVARVHVYAVHEKVAYGLDDAAVDGIVQHRAAGEIAYVVGGAVVAQLFDDVQVAGEGGQHQRRLATAVLRVHVDAARHKQLHNPKHKTCQRLVFNVFKMR